MSQLYLASDFFFFSIKNNNLNDGNAIDNNINVLQADIDRINNRLETSLKAHFPDLTENDIQVYALHLLKLSTKEIAAIRGVTPKSIQVARYRIKKKMKLSPEQDIVPFIELNFLT